MRITENEVLRPKAFRNDDECAISSRDPKHPQGPAGTPSLCFWNVPIEKYLFLPAHSSWNAVTLSVCRCVNRNNGTQQVEASARVNNVF